MTTEAGGAVADEMRQRMNEVEHRYAVTVDKSDLLRWIDAITAERAAREAVEAERDAAQTDADNALREAELLRAALAAMRAQCEGLAKEWIADAAEHANDPIYGINARAYADELRALASGSAGGEAT